MFYVRKIFRKTNISYPLNAISLDVLEFSHIKRIPAEKMFNCEK